MPYPLKSRITRTEFRSLLNANPVMASLAADQQNYCIDKAVQKVCSLRNSLAKEDYLEDNVSNSASVAAESSTHYGTTAERTAYGATLSSSDIPTMFFDTDLDRPYWWNGSEWV